MPWLQVSGEALPDGLAIGHGAGDRVNAQQVDTAQQKGNDSTSKIVPTYQTAEGDIAPVVGGTEEIAQGLAAYRIHRPGPGAAQQRTQPLAAEADVLAAEDLAGT